jgi:hypothetical protein
MILLSLSPFISRGFDSSPGHTGKTKTRFLKNRVFVLETELLQFRACRAPEERSAVSADLQA